MTGYGSERVAYEMETTYCDANFEKSVKKAREKDWNEEEGEW